MLLNSFFPTLPTTWDVIFIYVGAYLSIILLVYSVFIEQHHRQDLIRLLGTGGLLVYALYIGHPVFVVAMGALAIASLIEFVEIYIGLHKHGKHDLKKYKKMWRIKAGETEPMYKK